MEINKNLKGLSELIEEINLRLQEKPIFEHLQYTGREVRIEGDKYYDIRFPSIAYDNSVIGDTSMAELMYLLGDELTRISLEIEGKKWI